MKATFDGSSALIGREGLVFFEQSGYGRPGKTGLILSPVEALHLLHRRKIEIEGHTFDSFLTTQAEKKEFLRSYLVYRDIRERGYVVQPGPHDFRVFRRGEKPRTGRSQYMVRVLSERQPVKFDAMIGEVQAAINMRKQFVLAVVDDEDELTYYEVKLPVLPTVGNSATPGPLEGALAGSSVIAIRREDAALEETWFGTSLDDERVLLSPVETIFLLQKNLITLEGPFDGSESFIDRQAETDVDLIFKTIVYTHLRDLGYIPRTGYKFGHHFRVYSGQKKHSEMLVHALDAPTAMPMSLVSRSVRLAHSVRKKMLFACVQQNTIQYIEFARIKL